MATPRRIPLLAGGLVVIGLVVAALAVAAIRRPVHYDAATPEGTAQGFLEAVFDGDVRAARAYLTPRLQERCRNEMREMWAPAGARAILEETYVDGGTAEVDVTISVTRPPSLIPEPGHDFRVTLVMTRAGGGWAISEVPWPLYDCDWRDVP